MFAIIEIAGFQEKVRKGDQLHVPRLSAEEGKTVQFSDVLLFADDKGEVAVGTPHVSGASVKVKVLEHGKDKKIPVFKMLRRKRYRRLYGHRQPYTTIEVTEVLGDSSPGSSSKATQQDTKRASSSKQSTKKTATKQSAKKSSANKKGSRKSAAKKTSTKKKTSKKSTTKKSPR